MFSAQFGGKFTPVLLTFEVVTPHPAKDRIRNLQSGLVLPPA